MFKKNNTKGIEVVKGNFKHTLPLLFMKLNTFDLLYIDGDHTYDSTKFYFETALKYKHNNSVIIFDDIYWSKEMTRCWREIKEHHEVNLSIDCFYFGMVFFKNEIKQKKHFELYV